VGEPARIAGHDVLREIIIIIIIAPLTIVSEDQWGDLECRIKPTKHIELMEAYSQTLGR